MASLTLHKHASDHDEHQPKFDRSSHGSRGDPQSLVCERCWKNFFNTVDYEKVCMGYKNKDREKPEAIFKVSAEYLYLQKSANLECSWCALVRAILVGPGRSSWRKDRDLELTFRNPRWSWLKPAAGASSFEFRYRDLMLVAFTSPEDRAAAHIPARPIRTDLHADSIKNDIQAWFAKCVTHKECKQLTRTSLPTRVIQVNPSKDPYHVRMLECTGLKGRYATLSYCWGAPSSYILTSSTLEQYKRAIPWSYLPQTIKDAIQVTRAARLQYLWVDAFCILQDDGRDKIHEIANMCDIYRKSYITIVAANADDASKGFLGHRHFDAETYTVPFRIGPGDFGKASFQMLDDHVRLRFPNAETIQSRAWTLQEQVLSQRVLYFGDYTLEWRCGAGRFFLERDDIHIRGYHKTGGEGELQCEMLRPLPWSKDDALKLWIRLIVHYSPRECTNVMDRLNALAGIAQAFSGSLGPAYYAGLWQVDLLQQLAWHRGTGGPTQVSRSKVYCAPSWSWASSRGDIDTVYWRDKWVSHVAKVECTLSSPKLPYGAVTSGFIILSGRFAYGQLVRCQGGGKNPWTIMLDDIDGRVHSIYDTGEGYPKFKARPMRVLLDGIEDMEPKRVLCFAMCTIIPYGRVAGLILEAEAQRTSTFRRVGWFSQQFSQLSEVKRKPYESWTDGEVTII